MNPGDNCWAFQKLRTNRPAATSSSSESDTCTITRPWRSRVRARLPRRTCLFLQIGDHVRSSPLQRRDEAEDDSSRQREHAGERQHASVHAERQLHRDVGGWCERRQHACAEPRDDESGAAAERGKQQALDQELARQSGAAGTDRESNRHFAAARQRSSEQQVGDIRACQQQDDGDDGRQHRENRAEDQLRAPGRFRERQYPRREPFIAAWVRLDQTAADRLELGLRGVNRRVTFEPCHPLEPAHAPRLEPVTAREELRLHHDRDPHIERNPDHRPLEGWWQDADDREGMAVDRRWSSRPSQDRRRTGDATSRR